MQNLAKPSLDVHWVRSFIKKHSEDRPVLLAVSGGLDSMVLWDLVHKSSLVYAVAHVNYHLRAENSELDAQLVEQTAEQRGIQLALHNDYSLSKNSTGLQAHARDVRYKFFEQLCDDFPVVCTAHHADDQVETVLLQLGRGGGPKSMAGISDTYGNRLRPLLSFSKNELSAYAKTYKVKFREDSSNATDEYLRNRVRHHLAPLADKIFDGFRQNISRTALQQQELLLFAEEMVIQKLTELRSTEWPHTLDRNKLAKLPGRSYFIHELLRKHDFSAESTIAISNALGDEVVKKRQYFNRGESLRLVISGQTLHVEYTKPFEPFQIIIERAGEYTSPLGTLTVTEVQGEAGQNDDHNKALHESEIWVPSLSTITWRTTRKDDRIQIAMTQSKNAKRVLAEAKLPSLSQHASSTITTDKEALWIVNVRKSASLEKSKAKTAGYCLRFTSLLLNPGIMKF